MEKPSKMSQICGDSIEIRQTHLLHFVFGSSVVSMTYEGAIGLVPRFLIQVRPCAGSFHVGRWSGRSAGGSAIAQAWATLPTVPLVSLRRT